MTNSKIDTYKNTAENAHHIGWVHVPEYCIGDQAAPLVAHFPAKGLFIYHSAEQDPWYDVAVPHIYGSDPMGSHMGSNT